MLEYCPLHDGEFPGGHCTCPAVAFDCSAADVGPGDSLRKIRELVDKAERDPWWCTNQKCTDLLEEIREICSNENR